MTVSERRRVPASGPGVRRIVGTGVVGVAGVASVLATAPTAAATPTAVVPAVAPERAGAVAAGRSAAAPAVAPQYGRQKYRVGVQVADGSFVPAGTTTAGTEITVVATKQDGAQRTSSTCRTQEPTEEDPTASATATFCQNLDDDAATPAVTVEPGPSSQVPFLELFQAQAGDTVTVTQTTVNANLVRDTATATIPPCETNAGDTCFSGQDESQLATTVTFDDPGLPPLAADDTATTPLDTPVQIPVFANDDTVVGAPVTGSAITAQPAHGTVVLDPGTDQPPAAEQVTPAATPPVTTATVTYTPATGFTGVDTFRYSYSTANGTATALVTVTVVGPAVTPSPTVSPTRGTTTGPQLAATGTDTDPPLAAGVALLVAGGAATALGRRRATHRR